MKNLRSNGPDVAVYFRDQIDEVEAACNTEISAFTYAKKPVPATDVTVLWSELICAHAKIDSIQQGSKRTSMLSNCISLFEYSESILYVNIYNDYWGISKIASLMQEKNCWTAMSGPFADYSDWMF